MTVLTSTGAAVNLTSATNWSPAQIPADGDDLVIGAATLTLDADRRLDSITFNNAASRLAISGTSRSVEATNGFIVSGNLSATLITAALTAGTSVTLTGQWAGTGPINNIASSTGGNLTLRTVGAAQSAVLFPDATSFRSITASWTAGTLTTIGRFNMPSLGTQSITFVAMSGGTWIHQSSGLNTWGAGNNRIVSAGGAATFQWTGSIDTLVNGGNQSFIQLSSSSTSHSIGQAGDTFLHRNAAASAFSNFLGFTSGAVELAGSWCSRLDSVTMAISGGIVRWRNQSASIAATDYTLIQVTGGTLDISGLTIANAGRFALIETMAGATTATAGTSITNTTTAAQAVAIGTNQLNNRIVTLASDPPTLPAVQNVASGTVYGYSGSPLTGTGIINDPAVIAAAMVTSFSSLPDVMVRTTIATLASQTSFTLTAGSPDNNAYVGMSLIAVSAGNSLRRELGTISAYVGSTRTVTLASDPGIFTIAPGDTVWVVAGASSFPSEAPANWLKAVGIQDGAFNGKGDWATEAQVRAEIVDELSDRNYEQALADIPTVAEFNARTIPAASYATASQISSLQINTRANVMVPVEIETPDTGTQIWKIRLFLFDSEGNMEAPDSTPTITLTNAAGLNRASRLSAATVLSTGAYSWDYTASTTDPEEQLNWTFTVVEGGLTRIYPATSYVVEETAYRFTSTDRAALQAAATQNSLTEIGTNVSAIKAKTDNLPSDPADQSLIVDATDGILTAVNTRLAASAYVAPNNTGIASIKAVTDNLPPGNRILISTNTQREVAVTGSHHVAADIHEIQTDQLASINTQVVDALSVDTYDELSAPPAATSSLKDKITWLFMWMRNRATQTATQRQLFADDGSTVVSTETMSDDGTTFTKGEQA